MELERTALARRIYETSHIEGEFRLRSGIVSHEYFDKYLFESDPRLLQEIGLHLSQLIPSNAQAIVGLELGGIPLATVLCQTTGLPLLQMRKRVKEYGTRKQIEGGQVTGRNLVIVEDVVTSGGQIIDSTRVLQELGASILAAICVIDRECGAAENLRSEGLSFHALFGMSELRIASESS